VPGHNSREKFTNKNRNKNTKHESENEDNKQFKQKAYMPNKIF
jgi:hypothetical protein